MLETVVCSKFKGISGNPVHLNNFNVFIGPNAAGKSNFVDALKFIQDVVSQGASKAVNNRFGWDNVLTIGRRKTEKIKAEIFLNLEDIGHTIEVAGDKYKPLNIKYSIVVGHHEGKSYLSAENLEAQYQSESEDNKIGVEAFIRTKNRIRIVDSFLFTKGLMEKGSPMRKSFERFIVPEYLEDKPFIVSESFFLLFAPKILSNIIMNDWRFYDIDVNLPRETCEDKGQEYLLSDGINLAAILDKVISSKKKHVKDRILKNMSLLVPGFEGWKTVQLFDGSISFTVREKGIKKPILPKMISDGTIRLLGILTALLYQPPATSLICIDEPERCLHPQVLQTLIELMRDVSDKVQIVATTHSAELVKWLQPNEVFMVDRINNETNIVHAKDVSMIDTFLEEFSLDELWLGGHLNGGKIF